MDFTKEAETFVSEGKTILPLLWSDVVPKLMKEFKLICSLPLEYRERYTIPIPDEDDPDKQADNGYLRKDGRAKPSGGYWDKKDIWHYRPWHWSWYQRNNVDISAHRVLFELSQVVFLRCLRLQRQFLKALDSVMPGYNFTSLARSEYAFAKHVLRLALYDQAESNQRELGKPHRDRNFITFHIADSRPGLRTGEDKTLYVAEPDTILVFPSVHAERITGGKLKALEHGVWEEEDPDVADRRWSIIFF